MAYRLLSFTHAFELAQKRTAPAVVRTDVQLITADTLFDAMFETVQVFPNVLRDQEESYKAQRQLQKEIIATQQSLIRELSTPIIPVSDSILVVPLIGAIDSARASQITASVLETVSQYAAQVLILDITGVSVVDTSVVNHLLQTARAARLLGATVSIMDKHKIDGTNRMGRRSSVQSSRCAAWRTTEREALLPQPRRQRGVLLHLPPASIPVRAAPDLASSTRSTTTTSCALVNG
jgi:anti-anti-sigma regulatory factor